MNSSRWVGLQASQLSTSRNIFAVKLAQEPFTVLRDVLRSHCGIAVFTCVKEGNDIFFLKNLLFAII